MNMERDPVSNQLHDQTKHLAKDSSVITASNGKLPFSFLDQSLSIFDNFSFSNYRPFSAIKYILEIISNIDH